MNQFDRGSLVSSMMIELMAIRRLSVEETLAVYKRALQIILEHGWIQKSGGNYEGGACFNGAIFASVTEQIDTASGVSIDTDSTEFVLDKIAPYKTVPEWNDAPERTEEEVITLMREVITYLEVKLGIDHENVVPISSKNDPDPVAA